MTIVQTASNTEGNGMISLALLERWYRSFYKRVKGYLSRWQSVPASDLDDLSQEVFLRLLKYTDEEVVKDPQSYLFRVAARVAADHRYAAARRRDRESIREPVEALEPDYEGQRLKKEVDRLPPRQREVLLLHVNDGLTYKQIAIAVGLTERVVLRDMTRAYTQLRIRLRAK